MPRPWTHCFEISMTVSGIPDERVDFCIPAWTPGSYLVQDHSRNLLGFSAADSTGKRLDWEKTSKNVWRVTVRQAGQLRIEYQIYACERSVLGSFLDDSHGFVDGASVFMFVDGYRDRPYRLLVEPYPGWECISTGLEALPGVRHGFMAQDFETLIDSPLEIGNQEISRFRVRGVPHCISIFGKGNLNPARLAEDFRRIVGAAAELMGDIPYRRYTFLLQLLSDGETGLEHANSMAVQINRWMFRPDDRYKRFLSLIAHEFFHVWNGKRMRPARIGPVDYTKEDYTRLLWISEGFTDYYSCRILRLAGLLTVEEYLAGISKTIRDLQETPGRSVQSAVEASFDAWIKFRRQDENSPNTTVSYYLKGSLIGLVLDLEIRYLTGERSLDDVMRRLYFECCRVAQRGFTAEEFRRTCEQVAGSSLREIFEEYCFGTSEMDFARYLDHAGLRFSESAARASARAKIYVGISAGVVDGGMRIVAVTAGSPAWEYGLNVRDEIIAVNGYRVNQDILATLIGDSPPGVPLDFLIARDGRLRSVRVVSGERLEPEYRIERSATPTLRQKTLYESWLATTWEESGGVS